MQHGAAMTEISKTNLGLLAGLWLLASGCDRSAALLIASAAAQPTPGLAAAVPVLSAPGDPPFGRADAIVDLVSSEAARLVQASWRYREAHLVETASHLAGSDLRASGAAAKALD